MGGEKSGKWETKKTKKFPSQKRQRGLPKSEKPPQSAVLPSILESTALSKQTQLCLQAIPLLSVKLNNYRFLGGSKLSQSGQIINFYDECHTESIKVKIQRERAR